MPFPTIQLYFKINSFQKSRGIHCPAFHHPARSQRRVLRPVFQDGTGGAQQKVKNEMNLIFCVEITRSFKR